MRTKDNELTKELQELFEDNDITHTVIDGASDGTARVYFERVLGASTLAVIRRNDCHVFSVMPCVTNRDRELGTMFACVTRNKLI